MREKGLFSKAAFLFIFRGMKLSAGSLFTLFPLLAMAQTNESDALRWLEKAPPIPAFKVPASKAGWEKERQKIRATATELLGKLPPRPKVPAVKIISHEDRGDYTLEKFEFDNEAGATVPGYLLVPKGIKGKAPAILYCHWHGGQYEIGKEELLQAKH